MSIGWLLLVAVGINLAGFLIAYWRKSDKLTDFSYGATFLIIAGTALGANQNSKTKDLLAVIVGLWGVRLAVFLLVRVIKAKKDRRFDGIRENFWKFGTFWLGQGITAWIILLPALYVMRGPAVGIKTLSVIGMLIALTGLAIEALADAQKFRFNSTPANKGKFITEGLWSASRHPNYFGEITFWIGVYIFCFEYLDGWKKLIGLISPLFISYLLIFVTGLPKLEKSADQKWGSRADYKAYKKRTNILIPLPPKNT